MRNEYVYIKEERVMKRRAVALIMALLLSGGLFNPVGFMEAKAAPAVESGGEKAQASQRNVMNFNTDWHYKNRFYLF